MPLARNAPKDWPPVPSSWMRMVSSGRPSRVHLGQRARKHGADGAVDVARHFDELHLLALVDGRARLLDQDAVQALCQPVVLIFARGSAAPRPAHCGCANRRLKSRPLRLPVGDALLHVQQVGAADQVVELADAQLRHDLAHFLGDEEEVVDHVLGLAGELLAQHRVLRGHAHRAGVEVALAHHDAALDHQRRGGEAEFVGAQQRADGDVAAGLHLAVGLHADAAAQAVEHQGLLRLGQADFPRAAGVLDRRPGRSARAAVVARDHHVVALALGHARGDGAHADFGHQLDADARHAAPRSSGRGSAAPGLRSNRCRGAAAARSGPRPAPSSAACRCTWTPCRRAAGRPRPAWRPAPS